MAVGISPRAKADLDDTWTSIAIDIEAAAKRQIEAIAKRMFTLNDHPLLGWERTDLRPALRSIAVGEYLLCCRLRGQGVVVLHGRRDIDRLF